MSSNTYRSVLVKNVDVDEVSSRLNPDEVWVGIDVGRRWPRWR